MSMNLSDLIRSAWLNAVENGYESELRGMSIEELTNDLYKYDCDVNRHPYKNVLKEVFNFVERGYK